MNKTDENHTLWDSTYLYSQYNGSNHPDYNLERPIKKLGEGRERGRGGNKQGHPPESW